MSLYADYLLELEGKIVIENDKGFVAIGFHPETCYIEEVYVKPEFRRTGVTNDFMNQIITIAKEKNCKFIYGSIVPSKKDCTDSLRLQLHHGFKIQSAKENFILLVMEIS